MKIVILSWDSAYTSTGFGIQTNLTAEFLSVNHSVSVISSSPIFDVPTTFSPHFAEYRVPWNDPIYLEKLDALISRLNPDVCIVQGPWHFECKLLELHDLYYNVPVIFNFIWEGLSLPQNADKIKKLPCKPVVPTQFASQMWDVSDIIPHYVDPIFNYCYPEHWERARQELCNLLKIDILYSDFVILNLDTNATRKNQDLSLNVFSRFLRTNPNSHLIMHNDPRFPGAIDILKLVEQLNIPKTAIHFIPQNLSSKDVRKLYWGSDVRLSMSGGEGFGVPTAEAVACGTLNVVPNNSCFRELTEQVVTCEGLTASYLLPTVYSTTFAIPSIEGAIKRLGWVAHLDPVEYNNAALHEYKSYRIKNEEVTDLWEKIIQDRVQNFQPDPKFNYGYDSSVKTQSMTECVEALQLLLDNRADFSAHDPACFLGEFVDLCISKGIFISSDESNSYYSHKQSLQCREVKAEWPDADICVVTDALGRLETLDQRIEFLKNLTKYPWVLIRNNPCAAWNIEDFSDEQLTTELVKLHSTRRLDIEHLLKVNHDLKVFNYQVWQNMGDVKFIPQAIASKKVAK